jgi:hypothetical protein
VTDDNKCKQALECRRVNEAQIDRCDRVRMIAQKRSPGLRPWPVMADHVLGNGRLGGRLCKSPEEYKAWSQNLGHEHVLTTFHGAVSMYRQAETMQSFATPAC